MDDGYKEFQKELEWLINKHGINVICSTPDFCLAEYVVKCLKALETVVQGAHASYDTPHGKVYDTNSADYLNKGE